MTRAEAVAELYDVLNTEGAGPFREAVLLGYMAEGQDVFCEKTGFFRDFTTHTLTLATGTVAYAIPARVYQVLDIWDGARRLGKFIEQDRGHHQTEWRPTESLPRTGVPYAWQADRTTGFIEFDAVPTANENGRELRLFVWRYSQFDLIDDDIDPEVAGTPATIEIPSRFHRALVEYGAYKAFMHHDMETQDPVKAKDHLRSFDDYVISGKRAFRALSGAETRVGIDQTYAT